MVREIIFRGVVDCSPEKGKWLERIYSNGFSLLKWFVWKESFGLFFFYFSDNFISPLFYCFPVSVVKWQIAGCAENESGKAGKASGYFSVKHGG